MWDRTKKNPHNIYSQIYVITLILLFTVYEA